MTKEELIQIRESLALTKKEFAEKIGVKPMLLGRYESGGCKIPDAVAAAAKALVAPAEEEKKSTSIVIESKMGGTITTEEILSRLPAGCDTVYVKPEENAAYWVKGAESGVIILW